MNNPTDNSILQLQTISPTNQPPHWKLPTDLSQKLNIDATYLCDIVFWYWFYTTELVQFILSGRNGGIGYANSAEDAECRGILMATQWAIARQISHLEIETDAQAIATYWENHTSNLA
ncbi:hypothetical protein IFM89_031736 [Coptis chinensis]|uniref:RNase H type-1 domain-containing protein n=1 Tax=Coptis chinensis TaxID=261450 RepID=A0A835H1N2_9MAGN|nr:hypothetical protein IFM89_031736 [Coptis chinensis]